MMTLGNRVHILLWCIHVFIYFLKSYYVNVSGCSFRVERRDGNTSRRDPLATSLRIRDWSAIRQLFPLWLGFSDDRDSVSLTLMGKKGPTRSDKKRSWWGFLSYIHLSWCLLFFVSRIQAQEKLCLARQSIPKSKKTPQSKGSRSVCRLSEWSSSAYPFMF